MTEAATNRLSSGVPSYDPFELPREDERGRAWANDPGSAILGAAHRTREYWFYIALVMALLFHGASLGPPAIRQWNSEALSLLPALRKAQHDFFWQQYDVEEAPKPPPSPDKPPEPPPPPEPDPIPAAPAPKAEAKAKDDPYDPPPTPAQAAKVLTQKEDPDKVEDLTGNTVVSGEGSSLGGMRSAAGTGDEVVKNPATSLTGTPGGTGSGTKPPPPPAPTGPDLTRGATLEGSTSWNCPFPPEADAEQIDNAVVSLAVIVRPDGTPLSVSVLSDPGNGFGRQARICALGRRYSPALDRAGQAMTATTPPIKVRFTR